MSFNTISKIFKNVLPSPISEAQSETRPSFSSRSSFEAPGVRKSGLQQLEKNLMPQAEWTASLSPELQAIFDSHQSQSKKQAERTAKAQFSQEFSAKARNPEGFHFFMKQIYGEGYDRTKAESFRQRTLAGDSSWLPPVQFLDDPTLQGGYGAFDKKAGVVYLNEKLLGQPRLIGQTYIEEVGHFLDAQLNKTDAQGDEGEMFRRMLGGEKLSDSQVKKIRTENDHGQILVRGQRVDVEFLIGDDSPVIDQAADSGDGFGEFVGDFGDFGGDVGGSMGSELGSTGEVFDSGEGSISEPSIEPSTAPSVEPSVEPSESLSLTDSYPEPIDASELQGLEGGDKDPSEISEGGTDAPPEATKDEKENPSETSKEREKGVIYLGRVEIHGKKDSSVPLNAGQNTMTYLGSLAQYEGKVRGAYVKKANEQPKTPEGIRKRDELKLQMRDQQTPIGKVFSKVAAENKERKAARAAKSEAELAKTPGKTNSQVNKIGVASETLGRGLLIASVAISAQKVVDAPEGEKAKTAAKEGGALAGAIAAGEIGAIDGAALGSALIPVPIVGTAVGALVGGVAGAVVGGIVGSEIGGMIYDGVETISEGIGRMLE